jgi:hypothetical protein
MKLMQMIDMGQLDKISKLPMPQLYIIECPFNCPGLLKEACNMCLRLRGWTSHNHYFKHAINTPGPGKCPCHEYGTDKSIKYAGELLKVIPK